jgi:hypothetical protein
MKSRVFEVLSDFNYCPVSNPVELDWLKKIDQLAEKRKIIVVGDGVTSQEYSFILNRANIDFTRIETNQFLKHPSWKNHLEGGGNPFFLFATPSRVAEVKDHAIALGFTPRRDFITHFDALRNRMVIDLRGGVGIAEDQIASVLESALSLQTLGGVDILTLNLEGLEEIGVGFLRFTKLLHTKVILFPKFGDDIHISRQTGFDAIEINITHIDENNENFEYFYNHLLIEINQNEKSYLMVTEGIFEKFAANESSRVYLDFSHDWYFDGTLMAFESRNFHIPEKLNDRKSKQMFIEANVSCCRRGSYVKKMLFI